MTSSASEELPIHATLSTGRRTFLTVIIMIGAFMAILDTTVVDVVIPKMMGPLLHRSLRDPMGYHFLYDGGGGGPAPDP